MRKMMVMGLAISLASSTASSEGRELWVRGMSDEVVREFSEKMEQVDRDFVFVVTENQEILAEQLLEKESAVQITAIQASKYSGKALVDIKNRKYYLLRGVYYNEKTGDFSVAVAGDKIMVSHLSLGGADSIKRRAIIVALNRAPSEVYVTCGVAK